MRFYTSVAWMSPWLQDEHRVLDSAANKITIQRPGTHPWTDIQHDAIYQALVSYDEKKIQREINKRFPSLTQACERLNLYEFDISTSWRDAHFVWTCKARLFALQYGDMICLSIQSKNHIASNRAKPMEIDTWHFASYDLASRRWRLGLPDDICEVFALLESIR